MPDSEEKAERVFPGTKRAERGREERGEQSTGQGQTAECLSDLVVPLLEEAKAALAKTGVVSTIETSWTTALPDAEPTVRFYCGDRGVESGIDLPVGDVVEFSVADDKLKISDAGGRQWLAVSSDEVERAIEDAVHHAMTTYYRELESSVR